MRTSDAFCKNQVAAPGVPVPMLGKDTDDDRGEKEAGKEATRGA